jgi:predicted ATPase/class 3 adenylate cyclase
MPVLPTGTVSFLFTDIEGSTRLLMEAGEEYGALLEEHRRLIGDAVKRHGGITFGTEGDAVFAVFDRAAPAIQAAADMQRALAEHEWPDGREVRVRAGIHSGEVRLTDGGYVGLTIHEVARIAAAAHGGQVLVSGATRELVADARLPAVELRALGEHRLKDITHPVRVFEISGDGLPSGFPPPRSLSARTDNLPEQLTSFIGRQELEQGQRLLERARLLTLTGPGGTGKTRLAVELALAVRDGFSDGVAYVPLDGVRDAELVPSAMVSALGLAVGVGRTAEPMQRVVDYLRDRSVLVVLDNFEQVVDAAPVVAHLLREASRIKVLATSRVPLRISGEQEFPIPPLSVPSDGRPDAEDAADSPAVRLFVERATAARPDFQLTDDNAAAVVDIVRRLDGLPLAIELAASRLRAVSVEALRDRLDRRLAMLTGGARDLPARQQTLRGAIEWSYELLDPADRELFERFGVFANAACLVEAEPVCGPPDELGEEVLDGLASLTEKNLLRPVPGAVEDPRFSMLATIREYATDRLAERPSVEELRRRHAETYLALVEACAPGLFGSRGRYLLDRLEQDHDNIRLALDWSLERGETAFALRFVASAWRFWQMRGHLDEAWDRMRQVVAMPGVEEQPAALRARAFGAAGSVAYWRGHLGPTHDYYRQGLDLARESDEPSVIAEALINIGFASRPDSSFGPRVTTLGRPYFVEAARLYRELGDRSGLGAATWALAQSYVDGGDMVTGAQLAAEALALSRETDNQFGIGWSLFLLGYVAYQAGRLDEAVPAIVEAMHVFARSGDVSGMVACLMGVAIGVRAVGAMDAHWRLGGAVDALAAKAGSALDNTVLEEYGFEPLVRPADDPEGQAAWDAGAALTVEEAVAFATEVADSLAAAAPHPN